MRTLNDYFLYGIQLDLSQSGLLLRVPLPDAGRLVDVKVVKDTAFSGGAAVLTLASPLGSITQTVTVPNGGSPGDVVQQPIPEGGNNAWAEGESLELSSDGGPTAGTATVTFVVRR